MEAKSRSGRGVIQLHKGSEQQGLQPSNTGNLQTQAPRTKVKHTPFDFDSDWHSVLGKIYIK